ncbi:MAG: STAS domain-containing protein [Chloroflexi bacterium]|nr:STAS domain-containing protein [Chloroflexota bacterium]
MEITAEYRDEVVVVSPVGSIDSMTFIEVGAYLSALVKVDKSLIVTDLSGVDYLSSAGLRTMLATVKECRQRGGDLRLAAAQRSVYQVLEFAGFTHMIQVFPDVDAAVASFAA